MVRDQKAAGSNPATSTEKPCRINAYRVFFLFRKVLLCFFTMYSIMYFTMYLQCTSPRGDPEAFLYAADNRLE